MRLADCETSLLLLSHPTLANRWLELRRHPEARLDPYRRSRHCRLMLLFSTLVTAAIATAVQPPVPEGRPAQAAVAVATHRTIPISATVNAQPPKRIPATAEAATLCALVCKPARPAAAFEPDRTLPVLAMASAQNFKRIAPIAEAATTCVPAHRPARAAAATVPRRIPTSAMGNASISRRMPTIAEAAARPGKTPHHRASDRSHLAGSPEPS